MFKKSQNFYASLIFSFTILTAFTGMSYAGCDKNFDKEIQAIIDKDRQVFNIPGIEVSIMCPDDVSPRDFVSGSTKINGDVPIQANHFFQVGSETKSFIAAIILQLEAEGWLNLEDKVEKWLPNVLASWKAITLNQLLNHTSGIYNYTDVLGEMIPQGKLDFYKQWSSEDLVNLVATRPAYFEPGKGWHYSNTNYILAGMIIEAVTGKSLKEEINSRFIWPLGLTNTYYIPTFYNEEMMQRMAYGYAKSGLFPYEPLNVTEFNSSWAGAAGANISTSHDMAMWFKKLMSGILLPPKQMNKLTSLVDQNTGQPIPASKDSLGYGLAIMHDLTTFGEESWWHTGGTLGYSAIMLWLKCNNVIITANANDISSLDWTKRDLYFITQDVVSYIQKTSGGNLCYAQS